MSWAKLDDRFWSNRKVLRAWRRSRGALGLYVLAMSYCAQHETDGLVDSEWIEDRLPAPGERRRIVAVLVDVGLFDQDGADYRIHDWLDFNVSRADSDDRRRRDAERKARGRTSGVREESERTDDRRRAESNGSRAGGTAQGAGVDPTRPDLKSPPSPPPSGGRQRTRESWERTALTWAHAVGASGSDHELLRAVRQSKPWAATDPIAEFRTLVTEHFTGALTLEHAPEARS